MGRVDGWMDRWIDGWMEGWRDGEGWREERVCVIE